MQAITIPARGGIRGDFKQLTDFFKSIFVPDFQYDYLALLCRQGRQRVHRLPLPRRFRFRAVKPTLRLELASNPAPKATTIVEGPVAECPHTIMLRLGGNLWPLHQNQEGFLDDILRFAMAEAQCAAIKHQFGCFGLVQRFAPILLLANSHEFIG